MDKKLPKNIFVKENIVVDGIIVTRGLYFILDIIDKGSVTAENKSYHGKLVQINIKKGTGKVVGWYIPYSNEYVSESEQLEFAF